MNNNNILVIGIAGGTGSGKSTLTKQLVIHFGDQITVLKHDDYYKAHDEMTYEERTHLNYDHPNAFDTVSDFSYTNKTVIRVTREALCHAKHKKKHARPQRKRGMNRWLHHRRQEQKLVYFALFKVSSAKDKTKYIEESKQTAAKKTA